jgi:hypothetical protein
MIHFFSTKILRSSFLIFAALLSFICSAQKLVYSEPVGTYPYAETKIIGQVKNNIIVWKYMYSARYKKNTSQFLVYDNKMKLLNKASFDFVRLEISSLEFINEENSFTAILQYFENGFFICKLVKFDENGNNINTQLLERSPKLNDDNFVIVKSSSGISFALLRVVPSDISGTLAIKYYFIKSDTLIHSDKIILPFDTLSSGVGKAFLDDNNLFIPLNDTINNRERLALFKIDLKNNSSINTLRDLRNGHLLLPSTRINKNEKYYSVAAEWRSNDQNTAAANKIFVWQLNKDLIDISSDTTLTSIDSINSCLQNIHYYNLNSIALNNKTSNIIILAGDVKGISTGNYFSMQAYNDYSSGLLGGFYEGRVLSMTSQKELNGNGYYSQSNVSHGSTWSNNFNSGSGRSSSSNANGQSKKILPQAAVLAILNLDNQNNIKWSQCFNTLMEEDFKSLITQSVFVNTPNALHIIYSKLSEKNKQSLSDISLKPDGTYTINPIISMDLKYSYIVEDGMQLDENSALFPCVIKGKLAFAKYTIE